MSTLLLRSTLAGVITIIWVFETLTGVTDVPPIMNSINLVISKGNPVPVIVISVSPSGLPVFGLIDMIVN